MAGQLDVCNAAPPCFTLDSEAACVVLDPRLFPSIPATKRLVVHSAADLDEITVCRKVGNPAVNMTVRKKDGTDRPMEPAERETMYCNRWFRRLLRKCRAVGRGGEWDCCPLCLNCDKQVYLVGPHLRVTDDGNLATASACDHFVCLNCLLRNSFRRRGFGHAPQCPFCNVAFDEDELVPLILTDGD